MTKPLWSWSVCLCSHILPQLLSVEACDAVTATWQNKVTLPTVHTPLLSKHDLNLKKCWHNPRTHCRPMLSGASASTVWHPACNGTCFMNPQERLFFFFFHHGIRFPTSQGREKIRTLKIIFYATKLLVLQICLGTLWMAVAKGQGGNTKCF